MGFEWRNFFRFLAIKSEQWTIFNLRHKVVWSQQVQRGTSKKTLSLGLCPLRRTLLYKKVRPKVWVFQLFLWTGFSVREYIFTGISGFMWWLWGVHYFLAFYKWKLLVKSYSIVGITACINLRKTSKYSCTPSSRPPSCTVSINFFITAACLKHFCLEIVVKARAGNKEILAFPYCQKFWSFSLDFVRFLIDDPFFTFLILWFIIDDPCL